MGKGKALAGALEQEVEKNKTKQNRTRTLLAQTVTAEFQFPMGLKVFFATGVTRRNDRIPKEQSIILGHNYVSQHATYLCTSPFLMFFLSGTFPLSLFIKIPLILTLRPPGWNEMSLHTLSLSLRVLIFILPHTIHHLPLIIITDYKLPEGRVRISFIYVSLVLLGTLEAPTQ